jgi:hypothetical protein
MVVNARALVEIVQERSPGDEPLALLETAVVVACETGAAADALIEHYVGAARAASLSWTLIGEALGVLILRLLRPRSPDRRPGCLHLRQLCTDQHGDPAERTAGGADRVTGTEGLFSLHPDRTANIRVSSVG